MSITKNVVGRKLYYNNFNLTHTHDTSGRIGKLIPVQATPVVAGDLFQENIEFNIRFSPLSAPAMARFNVHFHSFYVPYRIITPRNGQETTWEKFVMSVGKPMTEVPVLPHFYTIRGFNWDDMLSSAEQSPPEFTQDEISIGSLWDYLKLPCVDAASMPDDAYISLTREELGCPGIVAFNFLAYLKIWNDWYRRDQIEPEVVFPLNLGEIPLDDLTNVSYVEPELPINFPENVTFSIGTFVHELLKLRTRNYERDYFTSALPEPQFGDDVYLSGGDISAMTNAMISLSATSPIEGYVFLNQRTNQGSIDEVTTAEYYPSTMVGQEDNYAAILGASQASYTHSFAPILPVGHRGIDFDVADIQGIKATPFTVNELRLAMQLQGVRESINRGGTRYVEIMHSIHGVKVSDLRVMRPVYLGGVKSPISIGAVLQTSASTEDSPQGTLTGQGGAVGGNRLFRTKRIFEEDGVIMTIMSITPRTGYFGGIERQYLKHDPLDYYIPAFDRLGEQETHRIELGFNIMKSFDRDLDNGNIEEDREFGYNPRYEEYKAAYSTVTGEFRNSLANWNVFRKFNRPPVLSTDFIHAESEDFDRIFMFENVQNTSNEHFQAQLLFDIKAKRPMSKYSTPITLF